MAIYESYIPVDTSARKEGPIVFRKEQEDAICKAYRHFRGSGQKKFLWNAKMRFGKTLCALEVSRRLKAKRVLIITHRPVLKDGWKEDYKKIYGNIPTYSYGSKFDKKNLDEGNFYDLDKEANEAEHGFVFFASMQYLRRSNLVGGDNDEQLKKDILNTKWDLVVVDEAHEGTRTERGQKVIDYLNKPEAKILHLSGTPFNLYDSFKDSEIFTWDYIMEQRAKQDWDSDEPNPYTELPRMKILTYDLGKLMGSEFIDNESAFSFHEFFRTWKSRKEANGKDADGNYRIKPDDAEVGDFIHKDKVNAFLDLLCKENAESNYPFSKKEWRMNFNHTLWIVPGVKEAAALEKLLGDHPILGHFEVVNVAGEGDADESRHDALDKVKKAIGYDSYNTHTITLSCGRLTTGVTVKPWTAVFYLKGSDNTSTATYMQTIFRVQSPFFDKIHHRMKTECYVFDFAPDRTLRAVAETAKFSRLTQKERKNASSTGRDADIQSMEDFIKFCPVVALDGGKMVEYDANRLFSQLNRVYIQRVVDSGFRDNILYDTNFILNMTPEEVEKLSETGEIIGRVTGAKLPKLNKNIDVSKSGLGKNGKKNKEETGSGGDGSDEDKAAKEKARKELENRREVLRAIGVRLPLLIYGGDFADEHGDISLDNFTRKIDTNSWNEFMPRGFSKDDFNRLKRGFNAQIFSESGKRYRQMAREADSMHVEDRIRAIADIFDRFHNPDKETVLTPWRVVNMHLSDTIGGYCFFNERFDGACEEYIYGTDGTLIETVETNQPRYVDRGDLTRDVFNSRNLADDLISKILEINSKTGLYPLYVAYTLYRNRIDDYRKNHLLEDDESLSVEEEHVIWDDVLKENVYVACNTTMAEKITRRTLCGFRDVDGTHIRSGEREARDKEGNVIKDASGFTVYDTLVKRVKSNPEEVTQQLQSSGYWNGTTSKNMIKFNAVVGNPPYQIVNVGNGNGADPIYHSFIELSKTLASMVTLIHPARFLFNAGKTPKDWNSKMLNDPNFKIVRYWPKSDEVFPNVDVKGGIATSLWNKNNEYGCIGFFSAYKELRSILKKVKEKNDSPFSKLVGPREAYGLTKTLYEEHPEYEDRQSKGHKFSLGANIFEVFPELFSVTENDGLVGIYGRCDNERTYKYFPEKYISTPDNFRFYKVIVPKANGTGAIGEVLSTPVIGVPVIGHTDTFLSIGKFANAEEASACLKYVMSKFARCLLGTLKVTQDNPKEVWSNVPLQDFTKHSDIDWSKSISEIDQQLYKKYGLDEEEVAFIERMIKPME